MSNPLHGRPRTLAATLLAGIACLALAACGSSSSSKNTTTNTNAANTAPASTGTTSTTPGGTSTTPGGTSTTPSGTSTAPGGTTTAPAPGSRFTALRACLAKQGINLPTPTPGQGPRFLGGPEGAGLPKGVTREQLRAAMRKCGAAGNLFLGPRGQGARRRFGSPAFRQALAEFAACMNRNGVKLPTPNTSGGPVFDTKGVNVTSPQFKAARMKCQGVLRNAFLGARSKP